MKKLILIISILMTFTLFTTACEKVKDTPVKKEVKGPKITAKVLLKTNKGEMLIGLYGEDAPNTVKNFLSYVREGFYNGLIFHRVIPKFVIQGGGFAPKMIRKQPKAPIKLEIAKDLKHKKGILSMARTNNPDSATTQFFICLGDVPSLDNKYAVFGKLIEGINVLDKISKTQTTSFGPYRNVPKEDIVIISATIIK